MLEENINRTLSQLYPQSLKQAGVLISSLLGRKIQLSLGEIKLLSLDQISSKYPLNLILRFNIGNKKDGRGLLVFPQELALILVNILKAVDSKTSFGQMGQNELNLLSQLFGQFMKSLSISLSQSLNRKVNFTDLELKSANLSGEVSALYGGEEQLVVVTTKVTLENITGEYELIQLIPLNIVEEVFGITSKVDLRIQPLELPALEKAVVNPNQDLGKVLLDIPLQLSVELGRTKMMLKDILELGTGSIIELDHLAGEPVDIMLNNKLLAKGEVVLIDDSLGVRLTHIVSPNERF